MIKSDEEIAVTKISAAAADVGGEACRDALREGVEEWEVGREVVNAMTNYMATAIDDRAEIQDSWAWVQSGNRSQKTTYALLFQNIYWQYIYTIIIFYCLFEGINTDGCHNPMTRRKIQKGDIIMLNCFPESLQGYYNALERTFFLDHVDDASLKYWEVNCAVHKRGLELIKYFFSVQKKDSSNLFNLGQV